MILPYPWMSDKKHIRAWELEKMPFKETGV